MAGAKDKGVKLVFDVPANADLVLVDKVQIQQVVLNLVRNAVEAMAGVERRELTVNRPPRRGRNRHRLDRRQPDPASTRKSSGICSSRS